MRSIYIGYDANEPTAYHVLAHSILRRATAPISVTPLVREQLKPFFERQRGPLESTDFSISRFLVPYLSGYQGYSIFMDCDMLCLADIKELWTFITNRHTAVWVAPHEYTPKSEVKMQGQVQTIYPRKNWSSLMIFNNSQCRTLTPDYVSTASGLDLHRFVWVKSEKLIGTLPLEWNWLGGEYAINPNAKMLHYTLGGPWFQETQQCDRAEDWYTEYREMTGQDFRPVQAWQRPPVAILKQEFISHLSGKPLGENWR